MPRWCPPFQEEKAMVAPERYIIQAAINGPAALDALQSGDSDGLILDLGMPASRHTCSKRFLWPSMSR